MDALSPAQAAAQLQELFEADVREAARDRGTGSKPWTEKPALTRLAAMGLPMLPRPMKAMVVMEVSRYGGLQRPMRLRATITRMISLVPSRIWCTRTSRSTRSMGWSRR